jgi:membrane protease subunit HflK
MAPGVTRERLYIDMMQEVLGKTPKVMVDVDGGNNMMYLPLDQLMKRQADNVASSSRSVRLDDSSMRELTQQVINRIGSSSNSTLREGR